ncbi:hypothetical protein QEZ52_05860 [Aliisedimentitalea scapharcae]|uniref:Uncharacterized protein n=1 Tax=Aliisedimentitalea scapharcae TaxID=1524259 RepID=A0ABZ2XVD9_9RHOB
MSEEALQFKNRLRRLERKHTAMSNGYRAQLRSDGLIMMTPQRKKSAISGRAVILFVLAFLAFKGFLIANIGIEGYQDRVDRLRSGNAVEAAGSWVMQIDPASELIAEKIGPVLR